jgi:hypothetical protein
MESKRFFERVPPPGEYSFAVHWFPMVVNNI